MGPEGLLIELFGTLDLTRMLYRHSLTCLSVCAELFYNPLVKQIEVRRTLSEDTRELFCMKGEDICPV